MKKFGLFLLSLFLVYTSSYSQLSGKIKFGNVTAADLQKKIYDQDSSADAVVIADIGYTTFVGNMKGTFSLEFKRLKRAHILKKNGYSIADVAIELYTSGQMEEDLESLKAVTYNLENGKVVETKLDLKNAVFKDKVNKNWLVKKFTFPNIKAGSIIEFEYKIKSDFTFNLQPWEFQGQYPVLWSEYNVTMPEFFTYVTLTQGYQPYYIKEQKSRKENFYMADSRGVSATERVSFNAGVTDFRWAMKDVPPLKEENYTSTLRNHLSKIEFQLKSIGEPFEYRNFMDSWVNVSKQLMNDEDFGLQLHKDNGWLNDIIKMAIGEGKTSEEKARNIYQWVRDNFTCTNYSRKQLEQPLKNLLKSKHGNEAEINLLLTAMLLKAGYKAEPVMLSTRSHGYAHAIYPLMDRFNYVICRLKMGENYTFLDASDPSLGFGKLNYQCYNGHARVINEEATSLDMDAATLKENSIVSFFIINDEKGNSIGSMQKIPGYYESLSIRNNVKEKGKSIFFSEIKKGYGEEYRLSNERIDSLAFQDEPVGIFFDFDLAGEKEDIIYFNPMMGEGYKENPFKSAQRFYPVEMPYTVDETFNLQMEVPFGYLVDELPKQMVVKMNEEGDATFEYRMSVSGNNISFRSRLMIKRTFYLPEEYEMLREFFKLVVKKHSEQIVFKKK
jgi:hypothetical protein